MASGYWIRLERARTSRRRLMAGAALVGLGTALYGSISCSGGKSSGASSSSSLLSQPVDTSKDAKRGGTYRDVITADADSVHPAINSPAGRVVVWRCYSRLQTFAPRYMGKAPDQDMLPDIAESWEVADSGTLVTFKMRPNVKWDPRPPTNSRIMDIQDIKYSWDQFTTLNQFRSNLLNSLSPASPIVSAQFTDTTLSFKLAFPMSDIFQAIASRFFIIPREASGGFDPRSEARGSSPWMLTKWSPSSSFSFERNPNYYGQPAFIDKWEVPIVSEYSQRLAQFRNGSIFTLDLRQEDILPAKRDIPDLLMYQGQYTTNVPSIRFGLSSPISPFWDQRVRQAFSMLIDRDLHARTFTGADLFESAGLPVNIKWYTFGGANLDFDPRDKEFGPNGKYYQHDPAEAKKLLAAAGYAQGFTTNVLYPSTDTANFSKYDAVVGMLAEAGIKGNVQVLDANTEFNQKVIVEHGNFDGIAFRSGGATPLVDSMVRRYHHNGAQFPGFDPDGKDRLRGDPKVDDVTTRMRSEFDPQKRLEIVKDLIRYLSGTMYEVPYGGEHTGFRLVWPTVRNYNVYQTSELAQFAPVETDPYLWLDPSQRPSSGA